MTFYIIVCVIFLIDNHVLGQDICQINDLDSAISSDRNTVIRLSDNVPNNVEYKWDVSFNKSRCKAKRQIQRCNLMAWEATRNLQKFLATYKIDPNNPDVVIDKSMVIPGMEFTLKLTLMNNGTNVKTSQFILSENKTTTSERVALGTTRTNVLGKLDVVGPNKSYADIDLYLIANLTLCVGNKDDINMRWEVFTDTGQLITNSSYTGTQLMIPSQTFTGGTKYRVKATATLNSTIIDTTFHDLDVGKRGLGIRLNAKTMAVGVNEPIRIIASISNSDNVENDFEIEWSCKYENKDCEDFEGNSAILDLVNGFSKPGKYELTFKIVEGGNAKSETITINVLDKGARSIEIYEMVTLIDPSKTVEISAKITKLATGCLVEWKSIQDDGYSILDLASMPAYPGVTNVTIKEDTFLDELVESDNDTNDMEFTLIIPPKTGNWLGLEGDKSYLIRLQVTCPDDPHPLFADIPLTTNSGPRPQSLQVNPTSGIALITKFLFTTERAIDAPNDYPLLYKYGYELKNRSLYYVIGSDLYSAGTILPYSASGIQTLLNCCDNRGSCTLIKGPIVDVKIPNRLSEEEESHLRKQFAILLSQGDYIQGINYAIVLIETYNWFSNDLLKEDMEEYIIYKINILVIDMIESVSLSDSYRYSANELIKCVISLADFIKLPEELLTNIIKLRMKISDVIRRERIVTNTENVNHLLELIKVYNNRNVRSFGVEDVSDYLETLELVIMHSEVPQTVENQKNNVIVVLSRYLGRLCSLLYEGQRIKIDLRTMSIVLEQLSNNHFTSFTFVPYQSNPFQSVIKIKFLNNWKQYTVGGRLCVAEGILNNYFNRQGYTYLIDIYDANSYGKFQQGGELENYVIFEGTGDPTQTCTVFDQTSWKRCTKLKQNGNSVLCKCNNLGYYGTEFQNYEDISTTPKMVNISPITQSPPTNATVHDNGEDESAGGVTENAQTSSVTQTTIALHPTTNGKGGERGNTAGDAETGRPTGSPPPASQTTIGVPSITNTESTQTSVKSITTDGIGEQIITTTIAGPLDNTNITNTNNSSDKPSGRNLEDGDPETQTLPDEESIKTPLPNSTPQNPINSNSLGTSDNAKFDTVATIVYTDDDQKNRVNTEITPEGNITNTLRPITNNPLVTITSPASITNSFKSSSPSPPFLNTFSSVTDPHTNVSTINTDQDPIGSDVLSGQETPSTIKEGPLPPQSTPMYISTNPIEPSKNEEFTTELFKPSLPSQNTPFEAYPTTINVTVSTISSENLPVTNATTHVDEGTTNILINLTIGPSPSPSIADVDSSNPTIDPPASSTFTSENPKTPEINKPSVAGNGNETPTTIYFNNNTSELPDITKIPTSSSIINTTQDPDSRTTDPISSDSNTNPIYPLLTTGSNATSPTSPSLSTTKVDISLSTINPPSVTFTSPSNIDSNINSPSVNKPSVTGNENKTPTTIRVNNNTTSQKPALPSNIPVSTLSVNTEEPNSKQTGISANPANSLVTTASTLTSTYKLIPEVSLSVSSAFSTTSLNSPSTVPTSSPSFSNVDAYSERTENNSQSVTETTQYISTIASNIATIFPVTVSLSESPIPLDPSIQVTDVNASGITENIQNATNESIPESTTSSTASPTINPSPGTLNERENTSTLTITSPATIINAPTNPTSLSTNTQVTDANSSERDNGLNTIKSQNTSPGNDAENPTTVTTGISDQNTTIITSQNTTSKQEQETSTLVAGDGQELPTTINIELNTADNVDGTTVSLRGSGDGQNITANGDDKITNIPEDPVGNSLGTPHTILNTPSTEPVPRVDVLITDLSLDSFSTEDSTAGSDFETLSSSPSVEFSADITTVDNTLQETTHNASTMTLSDTHIITTVNTITEDNNPTFDLTSDGNIDGSHITRNTTNSNESTGIDINGSTVGGLYISTITNTGSTLSPSTHETGLTSDDSTASPNLASVTNPDTNLVEVTSPANENLITNGQINIDVSKQSTISTGISSEIEDNFTLSKETPAATDYLITITSSSEETNATDNHLTKITDEDTSDNNSSGKSSASTTSVFTNNKAVTTTANAYVNTDASTNKGENTSTSTINNIPVIRLATSNEPESISTSNPIDLTSGEWDLTNISAYTSEITQIETLAANMPYGATPPVDISSESSGMSILTSTISDSINARSENDSSPNTQFSNYPSIQQSDTVPFHTSTVENDEPNAHTTTESDIISKHTLNPLTDVTSPPSIVTNAFFEDDLPTNGFPSITPFNTLISTSEGPNTQTDITHYITDSFSSEEISQTGNNQISSLTTNTKTNPIDMISTHLNEENTEKSISEEATETSPFILITEKPTSEKQSSAALFTTPDEQNNNNPSIPISDITSTSSDLATTNPYTLTAILPYGATPPLGSSPVSILLTSIMPNNSPIITTMTTEEISSPTATIEGNSESSLASTLSANMPYAATPPADNSYVSNTLLGNITVSEPSIPDNKSSDKNLNSNFPTSQIYTTVNLSSMQRGSSETTPTDHSTQDVTIEKSKISSDESSTPDTSVRGNLSITQVYMSSANISYTETTSLEGLYDSNKLTSTISNFDTNVIEDNRDPSTENNINSEISSNINSITPETSSSIPSISSSSENNMIPSMLPLDGKALIKEAAKNIATDISAINTDIKSTQTYTLSANMAYTATTSLSETNNLAPNIDNEIPNTIHTTRGDLESKISPEAGFSSDTLIDTNFPNTQVHSQSDKMAYTATPPVGTASETAKLTLPTTNIPNEGSSSHNTPLYTKDAETHISSQVYDIPTNAAIKTLPIVNSSEINTASSQSPKTNETSEASGNNNFSLGITINNNSDSTLVSLLSNYITHATTQNLHDSNTETSVITNATNELNIMVNMLGQSLNTNSPKQDVISNVENSITSLKKLEETNDAFTSITDHIDINSSTENSYTRGTIKPALSENLLSIDRGDTTRASNIDASATLPDSNTEDTISLPGIIYSTRSVSTLSDSTAYSETAFVNNASNASTTIIGDSSHESETQPYISNSSTSAVNRASTPAPENPETLGTSLSVLNGSADSNGSNNSHSNRGSDDSSGHLNSNPATHSNASDTESYLASSSTNNNSSDNDNRPPNLTSSNVNNSNISTSTTRNNSTRSTNASEPETLSLSDGNARANRSSTPIQRANILSKSDEISLIIIGVSILGIVLLGVVGAVMNRVKRERTIETTDNVEFPRYANVFHQDTLEGVPP